ncbi:MAG TPA: NUDIX domain-containing protein [Patescibacteria group bacterium]|nr:NUDIX domain-containing protein [Patescibacteria group bacterium]
MSKELKFAPRETFEQILEWSVIPTFDLIIEIELGKIILVRRKIEPYADTWALPGLRMFKPESIEDTLSRIAQNEVGLRIDAKQASLLDQYVGRFKTEHQRQDLSTAYIVRALPGEITLNMEHFTSHQIISKLSDVPAKTGAMYKYYLRRYFESV